ncbi:hypothetical protein SBOR_6504 [Sclerotinia borealis F-4128]|uniref:Uncharacterized protein n=1 Tax=Sclerotinia borealis (strain F-4128) TaxID=1432307 RepID=W9C8Q0_SCLBF|nr:hypothetical protein SBOR_6504 [Sclerotinia borealis F-4128]
MEAPGSIDDLEIQHEGYVKQAMGYIGGILGQIQIELEKHLSDGIKAHKDPRLPEIERPTPSICSGEREASDNSGRDQAALQLIQAKRRIQELEAEVRNLRARSNLAQANPPPQNVQALNNEITRLTEHNAELQEEVDACAQRLEAAKQESNRFFRYIISSKARPIHMDNFFVLNFNKLWRKTQQIGHLLKDSDQRPREIEGRQRTPRDVFLSSIWGHKNLGPEEIRNRNITAVFEFLNDKILLKPAFDLDDEDGSGAIEKALVEFETRVQNSPEGSHPLKSDIIEWRKFTIGCAKRLQTKNRGTKINALVAALWNFLEPLRVADNSPQNINQNRKLRKQILELCTESFHLSQLMRVEPNSEFEIVVPQPGSQVPDDPEEGTRPVEPYAEEGGYPAQLAGTVAFTQFGGLTRINQISGGGGGVVLVSTWVTLKAA